MSKDETKQIIDSFNNEKYDLHVKNIFDQSDYRNKWSKDKIISTLQKAFENGFHGIHFISSEYEGAIGHIFRRISGS